MHVTKTIRLSELKRAIERDHYLLCAYDTSESWQQKGIVILPELDEPAWVLKPGTRNADRRSNRAVLALPSLAALTLAIAQEHAGVHTDYITVREWTRDDRRAGRVRAGSLVQHSFTTETLPAVA